MGMKFIVRVIRSFVLNLNLSALYMREAAILEQASKPTGKADAFGIMVALEQIRCDRERLFEKYGDLYQ